MKSSISASISISMLLLVVACGPGSERPADLGATPTEIACFGPDLDISSDPLAEDDLSALAARAGLDPPRFPRGLTLREGGLLQDGALLGLSVNLVSADVAGPAIIIRMTPLQPCFPSELGAPAFSLDGVKVFSTKRGTLVGYEATLEVGGTVSRIEVGWRAAMAPSSADRQEFFGTWLEEFKKLN